MNNKQIWFLTGSQSLYGEDVLESVARHSEEIASHLNDGAPLEIVYKGTLKSSEEIFTALKDASTSENCVGIITWMHTFSPAKMWIKGLNALTKPMLHFHTQYNEELPYDEIDMDFMNLNQAAHGDREFGFIGARMRIAREVVVGYYKHQDVKDKIYKWSQVASALDFSKNLKVATFGSNMRDVAVTDGDRVEAEMKFGWSVNYYGIGDLVEIANGVTEDEISKKMKEYSSIYEIKTDSIDSVKEQAKYEIALDKFLTNGGFHAYTDTFQDLHGLRQLPGLATQRMMAKGIGFGAEGDWKTSAMDAVMNFMAKGRKGATGFMEDYTYNLIKGEELVLGSHMLEVSPSFAKNKPSIEVHHLGIGDKEPPARLVFDGIEGDAVAVTLTDMGDRFRMICHKIQLVKQPKPMPKLPVARIMWKLLPDHKTGAAAWIYAGGAHHTVVSTALDTEDMRLFAKLAGIEFVSIDENTNINTFQKELELSDILYKLKGLN